MRHIYINIAVNYLCERSQIVIPVKHNPKKTTPRPLLFLIYFIRGGILSD